MISKSCCQRTENFILAVADRMIQHDLSVVQACLGAWSRLLSV